MSTGFLVGDPIGRRVFRQVRGTVSPIGPVITAATAESQTGAGSNNTSALGPRACQFRGSNDIYCTIYDQIFRYSVALGDWVSVYTYSVGPYNINAHNTIGPVVMPVNGVQTMVIVSFLVSGSIRFITSTDGVTWTESGNVSTGVGNPEAYTGVRIDGQAIKVIWRFSSQLYLATLNPTTQTLSVIQYFAQGLDGASNDYSASARFKGREFVMGYDRFSGTRTDPSMYEVVGGTFTKVFSFSGGTPPSFASNVDAKWCLFESQGKLIGFVLFNDDFAGDTTQGWHAYVMDVTGVGGALQVESEITDVVFPPALGRDSGVSSNSGWLPIIDYEANISGEPEIGLIFRGAGGGVVGASIEYYIWNGIAAVIGNGGAAQDVGSDASFGFPYDPTGSSKYFWTQDDIDVAIDGILPALGGEEVTVSLYAPETVVNHGAVAGGPFEAGETVTSTSGGSAQIARDGVGTGLILLTNVTGDFLNGDTITQTTGTNAGANATQSGAATQGPVAVNAFFLFQTFTQTQFTRATIASVSSGVLNVGTKTIESLTARSEGTQVSAVLDTVGDAIPIGELVDLRANTEVP